MTGAVVEVVVDVTAAALFLGGTPSSSVNRSNETPTVSMARTVLLLLLLLLSYT